MVRPFRDIAAGRKRAGYCASRRATTHVRTRHRGTADICAFETFGRRLESVKSGCGAVSGRPAPSFPRIAQCSRALRPARSRSPTTQRLQPFRHHHDSGCFHWSDCRVGLAPTGKRLVTTHRWSGPFRTAALDVGVGGECGSPREGPDSGREPPFLREREVGFITQPCPTPNSPSAPAPRRSQASRPPAQSLPGRC